MTIITNDNRLDAKANVLEHQAELLNNRNVLTAYQRACMNDWRDEALAIRATLRELADLRAQVASFKEGKVDDAGN